MAQATSDRETGSELASEAWGRKCELGTYVKKILINKSVNSKASQ